MIDKFQVQQLFSDTKYGLQRVYTLLNNGDIDGVSQKDLSDNSKLVYSDIPFVEFLQQNISNIDTDSNGNISQKELDNLISKMQTDGLSYEQLLSMAVSSDSAIGTDKSLLDTVLAHFNEIDENKDGKVSQAEINFYSLNKEIQDKKDKYTEFKASDISIFYADASTEEATTDSSEETKTNTEQS